jgi:hypothetical protein
MGSLENILRRVEQLERRRDSYPERRLSKRQRTQIRVSRMYVRWMERGGGPVPALEPDEVEVWELFELYRELFEEHQADPAVVSGGTIGELSPQLDEAFEAWHDKYSSS